MENLAPLRDLIVELETLDFVDLAQSIKVVKDYRRNIFFRDAWGLQPDIPLSCWIPFAVFLKPLDQMKPIPLTDVELDYVNSYRAISSNPTSVTWEFFSLNGSCYELSICLEKQAWHLILMQRAIDGTWCIFNSASLSVSDFFQILSEANFDHYLDL